MVYEVKNVTLEAISISDILTLDAGVKKLIFDLDNNILEEGRSIMLSCPYELGVYVTKGDIIFYEDSEIISKSRYYEIVREWEACLKGSTIPYSATLGNAYFNFIDNTFNVVNSLTKDWYEIQMTIKE